MKFVSMVSIAQVTLQAFTLMLIFKNTHFTDAFQVERVLSNLRKLKAMYQTQLKLNLFYKNLKHQTADDLEEQSNKFDQSFERFDPYSGADEETHQERKAIITTPSDIAEPVSLLKNIPKPSLVKDEIFKHDFQVPLNEEAQLFWTLDYKHNIISFKLVVRNPKSVISLGFSDLGEVTNADFVVIGNKGLNGFNIKDYHTDAHGMLHLDVSQDYTLVKVTESPKGEEINISLQRQITTCDKNDYQFDNGTTHILFFQSSGDVSDANVTSLSPGLQRVQLLKPVLTPPPSLPENARILEITSPEITIPDSETTYWCYVKKLPNIPKKNHIVKFESVITPGNENLVHHMEVFHCEVPQGDVVPSYNAPCNSENKPVSIKKCSRVIGAWAKGAQPFLYPPEAGYAIGGKENSPYVMLEVHYNNPQHKKGRKDNSGIRFFYTPNVRKYDAGVMEYGLIYSPKMAIPPRQEGFLLSGECVSKCTEAGLPTDGINIFASQLHSHLTGRKIYTKHIRNDVELPELNRDDHYSPHFQEVRLLPKTVNILPGDSLVTVCEDNTMDRSNVTVGGYAISDEMCVNYVHYYPKVELEVCKSVVNTDMLGLYFSFMRKWHGSETSVNKNFVQNYQSITWTPRNVKMLQQFYNTSSLDVDCLTSNGDSLQGNWKRIPQSKIEVPFEKEPEC